MRGNRGYVLGWYAAASQWNTTIYVSSYCYYVSSYCYICKLICSCLVSQSILCVLLSSSYCYFTTTSFTTSRFTTSVTTSSCLVCPRMRHVLRSSLYCSTMMCSSRTAIYVSSYRYICVIIGRLSEGYVCVLMLLYMCPHTAKNVSS